MINNNHPITPPPELVQKLANGPGTWLEKISKAYCAGADQELDACCEWLLEMVLAASGDIEDLRAARRPKPPSLKEQALSELDSLEDLGVCNAETIRRALESLPS